MRTLLGTYPGLKLDHATYDGAKVLDLGFGDGRNMPLLYDLGFEIFGVEISEEICQLTRNRMNRLGVRARLEIGSNSHIPFGDGAFDFILSCHASYYVNSGESFADNLKRDCESPAAWGGRFVFSLPKDGHIHSEGRCVIGERSLSNNKRSLRAPQWRHLSCICFETGNCG